jgi:palmitoyltransferase
LFYNHHLSQAYMSDVCLEPIFWFVDNFTHLLGPFFVCAVACLTFAVVYISYWIGLPYWWEKSQAMSVFLLIVGNWLLVNVVFHYYKAVRTSPGHPPQNELIVEAVSICKKCIAPKPPRTHHCSVCNKCVLKMDHHCRELLLII